MAKKKSEDTDTKFWVLLVLVLIGALFWYYKRYVEPLQQADSGVTQPNTTVPPSNLNNNNNNNKQKQVPSSSTTTPTTIGQENFDVRDLIQNFEAVENSRMTSQGDIAEEKRFGSLIEALQYCADEPLCSAVTALNSFVQDQPNTYGIQSYRKTQTAKDTKYVTFQKIRDDDLSFTYNVFSNKRITSSGTGVADEIYPTLYEAQLACAADKNCSGLTKSVSNSYRMHNYKITRGLESMAGQTTYLKPDNAKIAPGSYLSNSGKLLTSNGTDGYTTQLTSVEDAMRACDATTGCIGFTTTGNGEYTISTHNSATTSELKSDTTAGRISYVREGVTLLKSTTGTTSVTLLKNTDTSMYLTVNSSGNLVCSLLSIGSATQFFKFNPASIEQSGKYLTMGTIDPTTGRAPLKMATLSTTSEFQNFRKEHFTNKEPIVNSSLSYLIGVDSATSIVYCMPTASSSNTNWIVEQAIA